MAPVFPPSVRELTREEHVAYSQLCRQYLQSLPEREQQALQRLSQQTQDIDLRVNIMYTDVGSGPYEAPSEVDQDALADAVRLRFLRARSLKVDKAAVMLHSHTAFREKYRPDTILAHPPVSTLIQHYPHGIHGNDKDGRPIYHENISYGDPRGLFRCATRDEILRFKVITAECCARAMRRASIEAGRFIDQFSVLLDLGNLNRTHLNRAFVSMFSEVSGLYEANYPETLHRVLVLHPPALFPVAFAIVKPFLNEGTREKIQLLRGSQQAVLQNLEEYLDVQQLPSFYGGPIANEDTEICFGGSVPDSVSLASSMLGDEHDSILVEAATTARHPIQGCSPSCPANVSLLVDDHDITFSIEVEAEDGTRHELVEPRRVHAKDGVVRVKVQPTLPGACALVFEFARSWSRSSRTVFVATNLASDASAATAATASAATVSESASTDATHVLQTGPMELFNGPGSPKRHASYQVALAATKSPEIVDILLAPEPDTPRVTAV